MIKPTTIKEIADGILAFLRKNNLEEALPMVIDYLKSSSKENAAYVYSPRKLDGSEKANAEKLIKKLTGESQKQIHFYEDKKLIDGLKINYQDKLWDFSVKGQINELKKF